MSPGANTFLLCLSFLTLASESREQKRNSQYFLGLSDKESEGSKSQKIFTNAKESLNGVNLFKGNLTSQKGQDFSRLLDWLKKDCQAEVGPVVRQQYRGIMGLGARADISKGATLLRLPLRCMITTRSTPHGQVDKLGELREDIRSRVYVAEQRRLGDSSFWHPWFDMVPSFETLKQSIPMAAIAESRNPETGTLGQLATDIAPFAKLPVMQTVLGKEAGHWADYKKYSVLAKEHPDLKDYLPVSWNEYVWAQLLFQTRSYSVPEHGEAGAIVPFAELANTVWPDGGGGKPNTVWHSALEDPNSDGEQDFVLLAGEDLKAGSEVTDQYFTSERTYSDTLRIWGFLGGHPEGKSSSSADLLQSCGGLLKAAADVRKRLVTPLVSNLATIAEHACKDEDANHLLKSTQASL